MKPFILWRSHSDYLHEQEACGQIFDMAFLRTQISPNHLVIPRYSALPYFDALFADIQNLGSTCVQTPSAHRYIADLSYYYDIADLTFPTFFRLDKVPDALKNTPFVVKGATNSRKQ